MTAGTAKQEREINIKFESKNNYDLLHDRGYREDAAMSQAGVTRLLDTMENTMSQEMSRVVKREELQHGLGDSWENPMSQWAVTKALDDLRDGLGSINVLYGDLVRLRDEGVLIPGRRYRITDYETICDSNGDYIGSSSGITCHSAGHRFDLILTAETVNSLNESASAIHHAGDTYFNRSRLTAWVVKYSIDNDTTRYKWASRSGKGVIYYLRDEYGNECHYDFKNIVFRYSDSYDKSNIVKGTSYYTFTLNNGGGVQDYSLDGRWCRNNMIDSCRDYNGIEVLPANVFVNTNSFAYCYENKIGVDSYYNTFGNSCCRNVLGYNCYYNHFPNYYQENIIGNNSSDNMFNADYIYGNIAGNGFSRNIADGIIMETTIGNNCSDNRILGSLINSKIGNNCQCNIFKNANGVVYGDNCCYNVFMLTMPEDFDYYNINVELLIDCENIILSGSNYQNVIVCSDGYIRNVNISRNVQGSWEGYNVIEVPCVEGNHELKVSIDSEGITKTYCEADLIQ